MIGYGTLRATAAWLVGVMVVAALADTAPDPGTARSLVEAGRYDEAIEAYGKIVEAAPGNVDALFWLGTLQRWKGRYPESLEYYGRALERNPGHYDALVGRARVELATGKLAEAETDLEAARGRSAKSKEVAELLAELRFRQGDYGKGESLLAGIHEGAAYRKALGDAYAAAGERARAIHEYEEALSLAPDDPAVHRALADLYRETGDLERAAKHYARVVALSPESADAHFWLGTLHRRGRRMREAEREFREALRLNPRHVDAKVGLGRVLNFYGRTGEAIETSRQAVEQSPQYAEARSVLGRALESRGSPEAYEQYSQAFALAPRDEEAWRGAWRTGVLARPTVGGNFRYYDTKVFEGRGNPPPFPIRTRYSGYRFIEDGRYPVSGQLAATASAEQFRDTLDQESADFTIYDVTGYSFLGGGEYRFSPRWKLAAQGGHAWFHSETDQPINDEEIALTRDEITFQDDELRFVARAGYHRGSLLGRSLGGDFDFALFTEDRALAHLEKSFADHWDWSGDFSYFHYSDGTERVSGYSAIDFTTARQTATIYGRFAPLQSRFLEADDGLEFVDVASGGGRYSLWIVEDVELAATYLYADYSDENAEHYGKASAAWRIPRLSPVSIGVAGAIDEFDRVSPRYNSFDSTAVSPFLRVKGTLVPRLDYSFHYAHGFWDESFRAPYDADEVAWFVEYFADTRLRVGTEGDFTYTAINERSQHYWLYVRVLF